MAVNSKACSNNNTNSKCTFCCLGGDCSYGPRHLTSTMMCKRLFKALHTAWTSCPKLLKPHSCAYAPGTAPTTSHRSTQRRRPILKGALSSLQEPSRRPQYQFLAERESAVQHLAQMLAQDLRQGDCYLLSGQVGAGKSTFWCGLAGWHCLLHQRLHVQNAVLVLGGP